MIPLHKPDDAISGWITDIIINFCRHSIKNHLSDDPDSYLSSEQAWEDPIVGFSKGDDPLFTWIKKDIGPFYWTPSEIYKKAFPDSDVSARHLSVISWILPQTRQTLADQRQEDTHPSTRWAMAKHYGEKFNVSLREYMIKTLNRSGFETLSPALLPQWEKKISLKYGSASNWSERHAAHVAGLGTFGLCDGLITPAGKAVRIGSVISHISIPPTPRTYTGHNEWCLFYSGKGKCRKCIERCPAGAISETGHDKETCRQYIKEITSKYTEQNTGLLIDNCGLCQTGIPCETKIPLKNETKGATLLKFPVKGRK